jgi:hypothetical protein
MTLGRVVRRDGLAGLAQSGPAQARSNAANSGREISMAAE